MRDQQLLKYLKGYLTERRQALFEQVLSQRTNHFTVVTEDVYQLHNTSAVVRSCDIFGIQNVHIVEEKNSKRIEREIAMGSQKWVTINRYKTVTNAISTLKKKGYQIVATTPHGDTTTTLQDFDISKPSAFCFGTEKDGLSDTVLEQADTFLKIPMYGFTESLNISVSAAIILQHVTDQLKKSIISWALTPEEIFDITLQWAKNTIKSSNQIIERYYTEQEKKAGL